MNVDNAVPTTATNAIFGELFGQNLHFVSYMLSNEKLFIMLDFLRNSDLALHMSTEV